MTVIPYLDAEDAATFAPQLTLRKRGSVQSIDTAQDVDIAEDSWLGIVLGNLDRISRLLEDWDDEGSPPVSKAIVWATSSLLYSLRNQVKANVPPPDVCPVAGGTLQLEWVSERRYLTIMFSDERSVLFVKGRKGHLESGKYPLTDLARTCALLDWYASE